MSAPDRRPAPAAADLQQRLDAAGPGRPPAPRAPAAARSATTAGGAGLEPDLAARRAAARAPGAAARAARSTTPSSCRSAERTRRHRRRHPRPPGRRRRRRDRVGQDHAAARRSASSWAAACRGLIGHTQPRRLAARAVAERIAEELGSPLGEAVGYTVRFTRPGQRRTLVKLMTDGILLAEIQRDRDCCRYDTLIVDEAHERSLNIDFLLGYLKQLLPQRPDLKVIITSATIDPERFAEHFGGAPVVEVSRPHATRSRSATGPHGRPTTTTRCRRSSTPSTSCAARGARRRAGVPVRRARDPRHRRRAARRARPRAPRCCRCTPGCRPPSSTGSSRRSRGRRVVLATNVAETSLTVPGHPLRRRPRHRAHLPLQPAHQGAAAADRADQPGVGRRSGPAAAAASRAGICIRLYSEDDFERAARVHRPGDPAHQPGRGHPADDRARARRHRGVPVRRAAGPAQHPRRRRAAATSSARSTGASGAGSPSSAGGSRSCRSTRASAGWSSRPTATACSTRCSCSPRRCRSRTRASGPPDKQQAAAEMHARFADETSDFLAYLNLWRYLREQQRELSSQRVPAAVQGASSSLPAGARVAGPLQPAARRCPRRSACAGAQHAEDVGRRRRACTSALLAGLLVARRPARRRRSASTSAPAARGSSLVAGLGADQEAAALGRGRRAGRDQPAVGPRRRARRARVGRAWPAHLVAAHRTPSRTGSASAAAVDRATSG